MKNYIVLLLSMLYLSGSFSQGEFKDFKFDSSVNMWNNFEFTLNGVDQRMNLYFFENGNVKGRFYENCEKKILFEGTRKDNKLSLAGYFNGKVYCYVDIVMASSLSQPTGFWFDSLRVKKTPFTAMQGYGTPGTPEKRYSGFADFGDGISDDQVEAFAKDIKTAVITDNMEWMADHTSYPVDAYIYINRKNIVIKSKAEFLSAYDKIITSEVKERVKSACPYNLDMFKREAWIDIFRFNSGYDKNMLRIVNYSP